MKRKGFTLVELLIVIVVIGILSTMMMLSSTEATTSAKVSNIVGNLRNLKTAALAYYIDNMDQLSSSTSDSDVKFGDITKYMNNNSLSDFSKYGVLIWNPDSTKQPSLAERNWYVYYDIGDKGDFERIRDKLKGRAAALGLIGAKAAKQPKDNDAAFTGDNNYQVFLRVR